MLTVTQLARTCGISRATVLYYEREGLLAPTTRSENGYRWYGEPALERLRAIVAYRGYGLPVASIAELLACNDKSHTEILKDHFKHLEHEIQQLRTQQHAIVALLQAPSLQEDTLVTKERWVEIMQAAGFDDTAMTTWHQKFEAMEPEQHQKFLESLGISNDEIRRIRKL